MNSEKQVTHVVEVFRYVELEAGFEDAVIHGADYPKYTVEPLKPFSSEKEAEEYARTFTLCEEPTPGGVVRVVVRPVRDWDSPSNCYFPGMVASLGTKDEPWR